MAPAQHLWSTGALTAHAAAPDRPGGYGMRAAGGSTGGERASTPERLRVLVIEPAAVLRNIMAHALGVQGFEVHTVDKVEGLQHRLASLNPHLVVTEATLRDGTGEQVCKAIKAQPERLVPVIVMSGMPEHELRDLAKAIGADRSFCKARGLSQLLDLVEELTSEIVF